MERTIDRTSYRRSARYETKKVNEGNEKNFSYIKILLNQIIVSLLIIISILTLRYFDISIVDNWLNENMSQGYRISELFGVVKNKLNLFEKTNANLMEISGDMLATVSGDVSGESGDVSGDLELISAVEGVNQLLDDAEFVKNNYELVLPVSGTVTSNFGCRVADNNMISSYHTGIDIGANTGTAIYAAHTGKVTMAKTFSSYGKCIMIEDGDLKTVYAHCSSINVSEGQNVNKGDLIGKVGMTGNATGPHLHLEIRYQGRFINPADVFGDI